MTKIYGSDSPVTNTAVGEVTLSIGQPLAVIEEFGGQTGAGEFVGPDPTLTNTDAALILGTDDPNNDPHIEIGPSVIQAKSNETNPTTLKLNELGGDTEIGPKSNSGRFRLYQDAKLRISFGDGPLPFGMALNSEGGPNVIHFNKSNNTVNDGSLGFFGPTFQLENAANNILLFYGKNDAGSREQLLLLDADPYEGEGKAEVPHLNVTGYWDNAGDYTPAISLTGGPWTTTIESDRIQTGGTFSINKYGSDVALGASNAGSGGSVELWDDGDQVAQTIQPQNGGLQVNNTLTGAGLERVLTASDLGGGVVGYLYSDTPATNPVATGDGTLVIGDSSDGGAGDNNVLIGNNGTLTLDNNVGIGSGITATDYSICVGYTATSSADEGIAIGSLPTVSGSRSISIGKLSNTSNEDAVSIGVSTINTGLESVAIGNESRATAQKVVALGSNAHGSADSAIAIGSAAVASSLNAVVIGRDSETAASNSVVLGTANDVVVAASNSVVIGTGHNVAAASTVRIGPSSSEYINYSSGRFSLVGTGARLNFPNYPTAGRPAGGSGDVIYDTDLDEPLYHNGATWTQWSGGAGDFLADGSVPMTAAIESDVVLGKILETNSFEIYTQAGGNYLRKVDSGVTQSEISLTSAGALMIHDDSQNIIGVNSLRCFMSHLGDNVLRTVPEASGGLTVNNLATGAGFERVLTESDLGLGIDQYFVLAADLTINNQGLQTITGWSIPFSSGEIYKIQIVAFVDDVANAGCGIAALANTGVESGNAVFRTKDSSTATNCRIRTEMGATLNGVTFAFSEQDTAIIADAIMVADGSGTITFAFGQQTPTAGDTTMLKGSYACYRRIA